MLNKYFFLSLPLCVSFASFAAERGHALMVGAGIAYPAQSQSIVENAAGLAQGSQSVIEGLYLFDDSSPFVSLAGAKGAAGLGVDYRKSGGANIFEGGLGVNLGFPVLGVALRSQGGSGLDGDLGFTFDLKKFRLSVVGRNISGGLGRLDAGFGFQIASAVFEIDVKKGYPFTGETLLLDVALSVNAGSLGVGVGYDMIHTANANSGDIHAGLVYQITSSFELEGYYRPLAQEIDSSRWSLGARLVF